MYKIKSFNTMYAALRCVVLRCVVLCCVVFVAHTHSSSRSTISINNTMHADLIYTKGELLNSCLKERKRESNDSSFHFKNACSASLRRAAWGESRCTHRVSNSSTFSFATGIPFPLVFLRKCHARISISELSTILQPHPSCAVGNKVPLVQLVATHLKTLEVLGSKPTED
jgi:hypothetical protein